MPTNDRRIPDPAAPTSNAVLYEVNDGVARVTLNRPDALNAINAQMRSQLTKAFSRAALDAGVRVVVLQGAGNRAFCAGADIKEFERPESLVDVREAKQPPVWVDSIASIPKPTIASISGYCLGGGLEIALACDCRIATIKSVFGLPEVTLGIIPGAGGTQRLSRVIGVARALELTLTGDRISAERALQVGLVSEVVDEDDLAGATTTLANKLCRGAPKAVAYAKEAILRGAEMSISDGLRLEADLSTLLQSTDDRVEGATAFRERRKPSFRGK